MIGLTSSDKDISQHYNSITYAMYLDSGGSVSIYEKGSHKMAVGKYSAEDIVKIVINHHGRIDYIVGDEIRYTSRTHVGGTLHVDTSFYSQGARVSEIKWVDYKKTQERLNLESLCHLQIFTGFTMVRVVIPGICRTPGAQ